VYASLFSGIDEEFFYERVCPGETDRQRQQQGRIYLMAKYSQTSPYFKTPQNDVNLGMFVPRTITSEPDDQSYTIERTYAYRPDLLAYDLYGSPRLWWVFAQRNPDRLEDPIYDFRPGVTIQLPKPANISKDLGV
jgi:hypothetical protein